MTASPTPSWRKQHPVRARLVLYGAGAVVLAATLLLLLRRGREDEADRLAYLEARLGALDVVLAQDPEGAEVLKVLDAEYADPGLPPALRARALRARAFAMAKRQDLSAAEALLDEALRVDPRPESAVAVRIERGLVRSWGSEPGKALEVLAEEAPPAGTVLVLWRALARTDALRRLSREEEGRRDLEVALSSLPRPLPDGSPVVLGVTAWLPSEVVRQATRAAAALSAPEARPGIWERLLLLLPDSFEAAEEAARGLLALGDRDAAKRAWGEARRLDPARAGKAEDLDRALGLDPVDVGGGLKPEGQGGR